MVSYKQADCGGQQFLTQRESEDASPTYCRGRRRRRRWSGGLLHQACVLIAGYRERRAGTIERKRGAVALRQIFPRGKADLFGLDPAGSGAMVSIV